MCMREILTDAAESLPAVFHEYTLCGPAAEGFDPDGSAAGEQIQKTAAGYVGLQDIKQSLFVFIYRGPGIHSRHGDQLQPSG